MTNMSQRKQFSLLEVSNLTQIKKKTLEHYCKTFLGNLGADNEVSSLPKITSFEIQLLLIAHETSKRGFSTSQVRDIIYETQKKARNPLRSNFDSLDVDQKRKVIEKYVRAL
tara:strand:- start:51 stop:386 length:336 start_codon:yes stop_codon:yes gene_type:complete